MHLNTTHIIYPDGLLEARQENQRIPGRNSPRLNRADRLTDPRHPNSSRNVPVRENMR